MLKSRKLYEYFFSTIQRIKGCLKKQQNEGYETKNSPVYVKTTKPFKNILFTQIKNVLNI